MKNTKNAETRTNKPFRPRLISSSAKPCSFTFEHTKDAAADMFWPPPRRAARCSSSSGVHEIIPLMMMTRITRLDRRYDGYVSGV